MGTVDFLLTPAVVGAVVSLVGTAVSAARASKAKRESEAIEEAVAAEVTRLRELADGSSPASPEELARVEDTSAEEPIGSRQTVIDDQVSIRDEVTVTHTRGLTVEDVANAVRDALAEQSEKDQADRKRERKADRRFAGWVAVLGFFGGSLVTIFVSWLFALASGAL